MFETVLSETVFGPFPKNSWFDSFSTPFWIFWTPVAERNSLGPKGPNDPCSRARESQKLGTLRFRRLSQRRLANCGCRAGSLRSGCWTPWTFPPATECWMYRWSPSICSAQRQSLYHLSLRQHGAAKETWPSYNPEIFAAVTFKKWP